MDVSSARSFPPRSPQDHSRKVSDEAERDDQQSEPDLLHGRHSTGNDGDAENASRVGMNGGDAVNNVHDMMEILASVAARQRDSVLSSILSARHSDKY